jgi:hypothetical protein
MNINRRPSGHIFSPLYGVGHSVKTEWFISAKSPKDESQADNTAALKRMGIDPIKNVRTVKQSESTTSLSSDKVSRVLGDKPVLPDQRLVPLKELALTKEETHEVKVFSDSVVPRARMASDGRLTLPKLPVWSNPNAYGLCAKNLEDDRVKYDRISKFIEEVQKALRSKKKAIQIAFSKSLTQRQEIAVAEKSQRSAGQGTYTLDPGVLALMASDSTYPKYGQEGFATSYLDCYRLYYGVQAPQEVTPEENPETTTQ